MTDSTEGLWMSAKERDRLKVLHEVKKRHITQKQAAAELGFSVRWVRKLLVRLRRRGDGGLRHRLRGRASNRKTPEAVKRRVVELYREKKQAKLWHDYGPTLAAEELAKDYGITIAARRYGNGGSRPSYGECGGQTWNKPMDGVHGGRAMASWCSGTPVNTIGW